jgi:hypothetical protein
MTIDRPIIFSAPMVRALLDSRKIMTRRMAWHERRVADPVGKLKLVGDRPTLWTRVKPGDRLWVREGWRRDVDYGTPVYRADYPGGESPPPPDAIPLIIYKAVNDFYRWQSPIHMARSSSRLTLIVTAVKIERLQKITHEEAEAEGIKCDMSVRGFRDHFSELWNRLHGPGSWDANPEVFALTFTVHQQNIDRLSA